MFWKNIITTGQVNNKKTHHNKLVKSLSIAQQVNIWNITITCFSIFPNLNFFQFSTSIHTFHVSFSFTHTRTPPPSIPLNFIWKDLIDRHQWIENSSKKTFSPFYSLSYFQFSTCFDATTKLDKTKSYRLLQNKPCNFKEHYIFVLCNIHWCLVNTFFNFAKFWPLLRLYVVVVVVIAQI